MAITSTKDNGEKSEMDEVERNKIIGGIDAFIKRTDKEKPKDEDIAALQESFEVVPSLYRLNGNTQRQLY